jgi:pimeloyl-ACP methyl ester carboxylesterase
MMQDDATAFESRFFTSADGLRLHMRDYGPRASSACPVVCLPGLSRNSADFDRVARALADGCAGRPRRVVALDYRGRGLSDRDPDWKHYSVFIESGDIHTVLTAAGIEEAIFLGTSRGGLNLLLMAAATPARIRAAILNDIGPVLETTGLARIAGYVGRFAAPDSMAGAAALMKRTFGDLFTALSEADWQIYANTTFEEKDGRIELRYDPALLKTLETLDLNGPLPTLWPQFDALQGKPLLVIRGENSDLLSVETLAAMARRHEGCQTHTVPGEGHAPLLLDARSIKRICDFVAEADPVLD